MKDMHLDVKEFPCNLCAKKYTKKSTLEHHIIDVHDEVRQECEICKSSVKKGYFRKHMKDMHYDRKEFSCNLCENKFTAKNSLEQHIEEVHNNLLQECEICNKMIRKSP